jgi:uncharacterized membrane protein
MSQVPESSLRHHLRATFTAGLVAFLPFVAVILVVGFVLGFMRGATLWLFEAVLLSPLGAPLLAIVGPEATDLDDLPTLVRLGVSAASVLATLLTVYLLGLATRQVAGRRAMRVAEKVVDRIPLAGTVYTASKQVLHAFTGEGNAAFQKVVLAPFPNRATMSVAFVTKELADKITGEPLYAVFIATTPNPTTGFVFMVRQSDCVELDWTLEMALEAVMSGGMLMPPVQMPPPPA